MQSDQIWEVLTQARPGDRLVLTFRAIDYRKDLGDMNIWTSVDYLFIEVRCGSIAVTQNQLQMLALAKDRQWFRGTLTRRVEIEIIKRFDAEWFAIMVGRNLERAEPVGPRPAALNAFDTRGDFPTKAIGSCAAAAMVVVWLLMMT
jgi:hypothetical protein